VFPITLALTRAIFIYILYDQYIGNTIFNFFYFFPKFFLDSANIQLIKGDVRSLF
jgi:hypothetical protein